MGFFKALKHIFRDRHHYGSGFNARRTWKRVNGRAVAIDRHGVVIDQNTTTTKDLKPFIRPDAAKIISIGHASNIAEGLLGKSVGVNTKQGGLTSVHVSKKIEDMADGPATIVHLTAQIQSSTQQPKPVLVALAPAFPPQRPMEVIHPKQKQKKKVVRFFDLGRGQMIKR
jgi:hypothetical protein